MFVRPGEFHGSHLRSAFKMLMFRNDDRLCARTGQTGRPDSVGKDQWGDPAVSGKVVTESDSDSFAACVSLACVVPIRRVRHRHLRYRAHG